MKRQANALTAVLENWQDVENAIDIYANSAGSALRENEIYLDSWEAKSKAVSAAWNELVNSLINSDWIKGFLDIAQDVLSWLTETNALLPILTGLIFGGLTKAIQGLIASIKVLIAEGGMLNVVFAGLPMIIGLVTTLVAGLITWSANASDTAKQIENLTDKIEEQQKAIDDLNAKEKEAVDLYKEYAFLLSKSNAYRLTKEEKESLLKISNDLVDTYGLEVEGIDAVTGAYIIGTEAINNYIDKLREERLIEQEKQTKTRNERIGKNVDLLDDILLPEDVYDSVQFGTPILTILTGEMSDEENQNILDYIQEQGKNITDITLEEWESIFEQFVKDYPQRLSKYSGIVNSIIKDVITNIQVDNIDNINQNGENVLTSMLQSILPNIEDLDENRIKQIQKKVHEFSKTYGYVFDELGLKNQQIQEKINSNTVGLSDYKDLLDNQMKQLQVIEQIFGATSEEANTFRDQLNKSIENNTGLSFAQIAKTMSESDLDTTQFDKVTSAILKLDKAMSSGEITFSEYMDKLETATKDISLEDTFKGDTQSAKHFFNVLTTKGKSAIQNLAAQMQNGEISQKDYLTGISDIVDYLSSLSSQSLSIFGADDETTKEIDSIVESISSAKTELEAFKGVIQLIPDTFEEMQTKGTSAINNLATALENAGITSLEVGDKVYHGSKQIAQAIKTDEAAFTAAQAKIAEETKNRLVDIGTGVAKLINGMVKLFGDMNITITPPKMGIVDWIKSLVPGTTKNIEFKIGVGGTVDEGAFGNLFADSFGDIDWGFDDFAGGGGGNTPPYTPPSSSDKDKPDKADPTDAIINRIASNVEALERQGEIIDNQLDMVDAEKEYDKYIELTNKALDNRLKTIEASKTAQNELSKEAQKIRDKYKGVDVASFFYANGEFTEAYNKYYDSFGSKAKQEAFEDDMKMIQEFKKAWFEYYDDIMALEKEVFDLRKDLQEAHYDHLSDLINQLERHAELQEKQSEQEKEYYDYLIEKTQALLDIKKAQFDLENKLISAQREAEKALATSKIGSEYLDEETRKLVYNDDDYKLEIDKINEISDYVSELTEDYISDLNRLGEDEMYKAEEITAQYERRIALKEKELEIVQAEVDLQKKQDTLNNVLAEKNIRQIVDGKWVWTHDTDQLRQATEDLADAEAQVEQLKREREQLEYTNSLEARIGKWQLEQEAIDKAMEDLHDKIEEFSTKVELLKDPLENFADIVNELNAELGHVNIGDYSSSSSSSSSSGSSGSSSTSGRWGSINPNANVGSVVQQMMNNSTKWHVSDSTTKAQLHATNQSLAASIGADYNPSNGKYYQNGIPLYDGGGVLKGLGGIKATKEDEIVLPPNITSNILDPEKNALFDTFANNLDTIFNPDLMPIQQIPFNIPQPNLRLLDTVSNRNTSVNYNMNGDVNITEANDIDGVLRTLVNKIKSMPIPD